MLIPWRVPVGIPAYHIEPAPNQKPENQTKEKPQLNKTMQTMKLKNTSLVTGAFGVVSAILLFSQAALAQANSADALSQPARGQSNQPVAGPTPVVFQAAGPNTASIQSTVDAFRAALGTPVNNNNPGPLLVGRREINWDGGNPAVVATTAAVTPFDTFLNTRGARFTTPGMGLSQATPAGVAVLFNNPTYANIFATFSPSRLFTPVGSNVTNGLFFIPGSNGVTPAVVSGFGVVFTDVDQQVGDKKASTQVEYFNARGKRIFQAFVPASPGNGSLSFVGIKFDDARIAAIRITTDSAPGGNDDKNSDIVMMDDFIYGEPQNIQ
jgi:hypothetical protein